MEAVTLQIFVSLMLVVISLLFYAVTQKQRDHEQADRLALLPLDDDGGAREPPQTPRAIALRPARGLAGFDGGPASRSGAALHDDSCARPAVPPKERSNGNRES